jgi:hypothetical protein
MKTAAVLLTALLLIASPVWAGGISGGGAGGGGGGAVSSVSGTSNQIDCVPTTGAVVCGLAATITTPGTLDMGANALLFTDSTLVRTTANTLDLVNGTNPQTFRLFNTATNAEWLQLTWTANQARILTATSGGTVRTLSLLTGISGTTALAVQPNLNGGLTLGTGTATAANPLGRIDSGNNSSNTATSGTSITHRIRENFAPTASSSMVSVPLSIEPTINYSNGTPGAGSYEAIHIAVTETALPTGTNYMVRAFGGAAGATAVWSVTNGGNETLAGTLTSSRATDFGWSIVNVANQACNTTCTSACVFGFNTAAIGNLLPCTDATADSCLCAGAS